MILIHQLHYIILIDWQQASTGLWSNITALMFWAINYICIPLLTGSISCIISRPKEEFHFLSNKRVCQALKKHNNIRHEYLSNNERQSREISKQSLKNSNSNFHLTLNPHMHAQDARTHLALPCILLYCLVMSRFRTITRVNY